MIATPATRRTAFWKDVRQWPDSLAAVWRRSMRFRTIAVTLLLTSLAIFVTCVTMALVIRSDLFESRKDEALQNARGAVAQMQLLIDSGQPGDDRTQRSALWREALGVLSRASSSSRFIVLLSSIEGDAYTPNGYTSFLPADQLSDDLRNRVMSVQARQAWQSIGLEQTDGTVTAGIVVGQQLTFPDAGVYEVYIAYDLADADETLLFVQRTLWLAGISLVAIVAAIAWLVLRSVSAPIIEAAETSARLAGGDLGVRLPVHGEDELAALGRSFNAMADSMERQIKELAELSLVQQRFVSDVSHELRTPLTTIRLAAEMINDQKDEFDATTARTTELLHTQVQRFEALLADLLEISRYDAGSVQLEVEATSLAHLAEEIVDQMRPLAETRHSELRLVAPGGYSPVDMDPRRVRRVLRNLVGNAIEHGEGHPIVITVDSDENAVAVGVRDFGMGMSPEDAERVFDRFWRADPSRRRTIGGTGLGLSIALGDAKLHGGTLEVWSKLGAGTHFVLTIPRGPSGLGGTSPVPVEPQETLADLGTVTEPIALRDHASGIAPGEDDASPGAASPAGGEEP